MNEQIRASAVWREALVIVLRHPVAASLLMIPGP
jgi:hypothetical protein